MASHRRSGDGCSRWRTDKTTMCSQNIRSIRPCLAASLAIAFLTSNDVCVQAVPLIEGCRAPTPPACAADGACYPRRATWGYYKQNWRRWPEEYLPPGAPLNRLGPVPRVPDGLPPEIRSMEPPTPEREDQQAPEQIEKQLRHPLLRRRGHFKCRSRHLRGLACPRMQGP